MHMCCVLSIARFINILLPVSAGTHFQGHGQASFGTQTSHSITGEHLAKPLECSVFLLTVHIKKDNR